MLKGFGKGWYIGDLLDRAPRAALIAGVVLLMLVVWLWPSRRPTPEEPDIRITDDTLLFPEGGPEISVLLADGTVAQMELETFLIGVVAAEMPANFELEALKAQAVAARTYVLSHTASYGLPRHENADVCTDSTHCQAYADIDSLKTRWGNHFTENYTAICRAVAETKGQIVLYAGQLVETLYCSTCGGQTEAAADVWGRDVPYLQSVACYWDSHAPRFATAQVLSLQEVGSALAVSPSALRNMSATYTAGGAVAQLSVDGRELSGGELRQALGLNSATASWLVDGESILFSTLGYGHGVGLCQYGADGMAKSGYTAAQILQHYYQGVSIEALYQ